MKQSIHLAAFGNALIKDDNGNPMLLHRGEHGANPDRKRIESRLGSISFCSLEVAEQYAENPNVSTDIVVSPRILSGYLLINNPVINDPEDPFFDLVILERILGFELTKNIALRHADKIENTNNWETIADETECETVEEFLDLYPEKLSELYCDAYPILDDLEVVALLRQAGYDGAIHAGNNISSDEAEYKIFDDFQYIPEIDYEKQLTIDNVSKIISTKMKPDLLCAIHTCFEENIELSIKSLRSILGENYFDEHFGKSNQLVTLLAENLDWLEQDFALFHQKMLTDVYRFIRSDSLRSNPVFHDLPMHGIAPSSHEETDASFNF